MKKLLITLLVLTTLIGGGLLFSPYKLHNGLRQIRATVDINAPIEQVFTYLGNSANAAKWSSYVHHITTINADKFPDGTVGSQRRCFRKAAETGETWDEEILVVEPNQRRRLNIFNHKNYILTSNNLLTEQTYERLSDSTCRVSFSLFLGFDHDFKGNFVMDNLKMFAASYRVAGIFKRNVANIKRLNEK